MADGDSTCVQCGGKVLPIITKLGNISQHVRAYCSASCKHKAAYKRYRLKVGPSSKGERVRKPCAHCGSIMSLVPSRASSKTFCSRSCQADARRTGSIERACDVCGTMYRPIRTKGDLVAGRTDGRRHDVFSRHCSRECGYVASARTRWLMNQQRREASDRGRKVRAEAAALKRIGVSFMRLWPHQGGPRVVRAECYSCGCALGPVLRRKGRHACEQCKRDAEMKGRRVAKAKRRAIERGADADQIDPIRVFERDKWRCQECGCRTPQSKRGSFVPNAPELDHIISLADGGAHTWANVQCLCRQCNQDKGASSRGQLHMFAA